MTELTYLHNFYPKPPATALRHLLVISMLGLGPYNSQFVLHFKVKSVIEAEVNRGGEVWALLTLLLLTLTLLTAIRQWTTESLLELIAMFFTKWILKKKLKK